MQNLANSSKNLSFNQRLRALNSKQQLAFSTALAQRASLNYLLVAEALNLAGAEEIKQLLSLLWESLANPKSKMNWEVQLAKLIDLQPDPAEFSVYGIYPALDACLGLELALEQALTADPENTIKASRLSRSSVRKFLVRQLPEDFPSSQESAWVQEQDLMQDEQAFQDELLKQVNSYTSLNQEAVRQLTKLAYNQGFSNLGISLDA